jgi:hypothetical protein
MIPAFGSCRKAPEIAGWGSSIPTGNLLDFFPVNSSQYPAGTGQKSSGNGRKISGGNTASGMNRNFAGSHRFLPYVFDPGGAVLSPPSSISLSLSSINGVVMTIFFFVVVVALD